MKRVVIRFLIFLSALNLFSADDSSFSFNYFSGDKFSIVEKSDLRRYENGRFVGLSYREVRGVMKLGVLLENGVFSVKGKFYVFEETKHENRNVAKKIDQVVPVVYRIRPTGLLVPKKPQPFPTVQGFPAFPEKPVREGDKWRAFGVRVVDPMGNGNYTHVRFYCEYNYIGDKIRNGKSYGVIKAQYAIRYKKGDDPRGWEEIERITGRHLVTIYYDREDGKDSFMSDLMEEKYTLKDGRSVTFKGFILTWFNGIQPLNKAELAEEIRKKLDEKNISDVEVSKREEGVALTINRIHFVANKAIVLPEEKPRLKVLADALKRIEGRNFLVVGHTARVGSKESQYKLSVERAKTIVDYLVSQGIDAKRFLYEGKGGTEPVAPNDTEENMAKNRRVEIIILED